MSKTFICFVNLKNSCKLQVVILDTGHQVTQTLGKYACQSIA